MAVKRMIVWPEPEGEPGDKTLKASFPYEFYAKTRVDDPETYVVHLVMPLGGKESGLFRYPKPWERILTKQGADNRYYLLGYLPNEDEQYSNFLTGLAKVNAEEKRKLKEEEGMALRYEQTGKHTDYAGSDPGDRYSEIGFYRRQTQWISTNPAYKGVPVNRIKDKEKGDETDEEYAKRLVTVTGIAREENESDKAYIRRVTGVFPKIDRVNIQSTGDLYSAAKNHQRIKAKRLDVLVDCDDPVYNKAKLDPDELPSGDNIGDDSGLHTGDMHIRASNRVVIKAGEEILLQVGRTAISIRDDALRLKSKIVNTNLTNAYDTTMEISGRDGILMFGRDVNINADKSYEIGDTFGGTVSSRLGILSLGGREIKAETYDAVQYAFLTAYALGQYAQCVASGSIAVDGHVTDIQVGDYIKFAVDTLKGGAQLIRSITEVARAWGRYHEEKAAAAAEAERLAAEEQEANELIVASVQKTIIDEETAARAAAGLTGDLDITIPTDPNEVAANHAAATTGYEQDLDTLVALAVVHNEESGLEGARGLGGDLERGMKLTINGEPVSTTSGEPPGSSAAVAAVQANANEDFARFLTKNDEDGPKSFANLTDTQKREVCILQSMLDQGLQNHAEARAANALFGPQQSVSVVATTGTDSMVDPSIPTPVRQNSITQDGDNYVIGYTANSPIKLVQINSPGGMIAQFDPNQSKRETTVAVTISRAEVTRLAGLNWGPGINTSALPDAYKLKFIATYLNSKLDIHGLQRVF
jgi:hypothetical protein